MGYFVLGVAKNMEKRKYFLDNPEDSNFLCTLQCLGSSKPEFYSE